MTEETGLRKFNEIFRLFQGVLFACIEFWPKALYDYRKLLKSNLLR